VKTKLLKFNAVHLKDLIKSNYFVARDLYYEFSVIAIYDILQKYLTETNLPINIVLENDYYNKLLTAMMRDGFYSYVSNIALDKNFKEKEFSAFSLYAYSFFESNLNLRRINLLRISIDDLFFVIIEHKVL